MNSIKNSAQDQMSIKLNGDYPEENELASQEGCKVLLNSQRSGKTKQAAKQKKLRRAPMGNLCSGESFKKVTAERGPVEKQRSNSLNELKSQQEPLENLGSPVDIKVTKGLLSQRDLSIKNIDESQHSQDRFKQSLGGAKTISES